MGLPKALKVTKLLRATDTELDPAKRSADLQAADAFLKGSATIRCSVARAAAAIPRAQLVEIAGAGHLPQVEAFAEYIGALVAFLLAKLPDVPRRDQ